MLALLLLLAQDVPAAPPATEGQEEEEEIVVRATFGHTTMLFDKGTDGRLRNCRIMVSSGSQRRDTNACQATPVCYAKTADEVTDCRDFVELAAVAMPAEPRPATSSVPQTFVLPKLNEPRPSLAEGQAGPLGLQEPSRETERQRVKLPPLPRPPSDGPVIRVGPAREVGE
ncbi:hypothetical protein RZN05_19300 [Sphingomonas sp. HF-S4]|uniref:Uncharacterized protein n=1 Tax=Sphingomonas agrestis TaxID=3080540 RepID=A0ABU3YD06_9SPHN|nr:hypothetical protein [Sphingomonas sp. HF-S4]MDV3459152.1 hypothetical protein [Sphingomonas sp. HF-S4]